MPGTYWEADTSIRSDLYGQLLKDQETKKTLCRISDSMNTFCRPDEYALVIHLQLYGESITQVLDGRLMTWPVIHKILIRLFPEHDLEDLVLPERKGPRVVHCAGADKWR